MAERIPGARFAGLPGNDHLPWEGEEQLPTPAEVDAPGLWLARISL